MAARITSKDYAAELEAQIEDLKQVIASLRIQLAAPTKG
jgi:ribosomal protein L29